MNRSIRHRTLHYSVVYFRTDPAEVAPDPRLRLGIILGFSTKTYSVVGMAVRATLDEAVLENLDPLSRELLEEREEVIRGEIKAVLDKAHRPEDVLALVAERNHWSLHVSHPKSVQIDESTADAVSIDKIADDYVFDLWGRVFRPEARAAKFVRTESHRVLTSEEARHLPSTADENAMPPPWMLSTQVFKLPNVY